MLKKCGLYVIVDKGLVKGRDIIRVAQEALSGGADIIQLRDKASGDRELVECARAISKAAAKYKRLFIVNDRPDIALASDSDGVHLGQGDMPPENARRILGKRIIGISTHNREQAKAAESQGADYIAIGPIFKTATKSGCRPIGVPALKKAQKDISLPFFAIGGISDSNIKYVKKGGAKRIAVASAAIKTKDVSAAVRRLKKALDE